MAEQLQTETPEQRKQRILSKFKAILIREARKKKLQKLIEVAKKKQGLDLREDTNDSPFVPSSDNCIAKFLEIAQLTNNDVLIDLGCGDARLLIAAAKQFKCKCIGIEIQPKVVAKAKQNVLQNNISHLVDIVKCDFKSDQCKQILKSATFVFLFLLPKIMPFVTRILNTNLNDGCRVASYIFDLCREKCNTIEIDNWYYPSLGGTTLSFVENADDARRDLNAIVLHNIHPDLKNEYGVIDGSKLIEINGLKVANVRTLFDFKLFERKMHNIISQFHQNRHNNNNNNKTLRILIQKYQKEKKYDLVKPNNVAEVARVFKNGSEMRSDLKLYIFPLKTSDFGWINESGAYRLIHATQ